MPRSQGHEKKPTVTLHMVSSLDGFIAKKDNTVSWLDSPGNAYEAGVSISEQEIASFLKTIDCYVLGSRTYEHAIELGWPYGDTPVVVVDEIKLTIAPVLLGEGLRLFGDSLTEKRWNLKNVVAYKNGFVELSYSPAAKR